MDSKKDDDIKKLVKLIDPDDQNAEWLKALFIDVTKTRGNARDQFLEEMDFNVVVALYYPIYDKYFTHDEIKELIGFYSSGIGTKLVESKNAGFSQRFTQDELSGIEQFKRTGTGRKYNDLLNKITHQHVESVKKYIGSLK